jgi:two-component system phosphate regulon response regulator PhoB
MSDLILIVEDEPDLVDTVAYALEQTGFKTRAALSGSEAIEQLRQRPLPDLVLLDLMLPDASGIDICKRMRGDPETRDIPVLMLTAKTEEADRIAGLEVGADDYVVKPFSVRELMLRVRAILRRRAGGSATSRVVELGRLRVDLDTQQVSVAGEAIVLSSLEFRLLAHFLKNQGEVLSRDRLLQQVWGISAPIQTRTVDVYVMRLREKLEAAGGYLRTVRGAGYVFSPEQDEVDI